MSRLFLTDLLQQEHSKKLPGVGRQEFYVVLSTDMFPKRDEQGNLTDDEVQDIQEWLDGTWGKGPDIEIDDEDED